MANIFDSYGAPQFGLRDVKIATWTATGSYGSLIDVPSVQLLGIDYQTVNAQLEGDDIITDTHANAVSAQIQFRFGSVNMTVYETLTGISSDVYGSTPNRIDRLSLGGVTFPYIGLIGKAIATQGTGSTHVFVAKMKVMEGFSMSFEYGGYTIPEVTLMAIKDGGYNIFELVEYETDIAISAMPPAYS